MIELRKFIQKKRPDVLNGNGNGNGFIIDETITKEIVCVGEYQLYFVDIVDNMDGEVTESEYDDDGHCYYYGGRDEGTFEFVLNEDPITLFYDVDEDTFPITKKEAQMVVNDLNKHATLIVDCYENIEE
jgi:hypothetical protein